MDTFGETVRISTIGTQRGYVIRHVTQIVSDGTRLWVSSGPYPSTRFVDRLDVQRGAVMDMFFMSHVREITRIDEE